MHHSQPPAAVTSDGRGEGREGVGRVREGGVMEGERDWRVG